MIRAATPADVPQLVEWSRTFSERAGLADNIGYVPEHVAQALSAMIENGHPVFIGESGAIGATATAHPFNHTHIMAQEVFWWSEGREGLRLFDALDRYCDEHCHSLRMITLEAVEPEKTGRFYERKGFRPLEHSYVKVY